LSQRCGRCVARPAVNHGNSQARYEVSLQTQRLQAFDGEFGCPVIDDHDRDIRGRSTNAVIASNIGAFGGHRSVIIGWRLPVHKRTLTPTAHVPLSDGPT